MFFIHLLWMAKSKSDPITLLMSHIQGDLDENECWVTDYVPNRGGYVRVSLPAGERRTLAHRFMWEVHNAEPLGERILMHSCDNPGCINPAHLSPGTVSANHADMVAKDRHYRIPGKYTPEIYDEWVNSDLPMVELATIYGCRYSNIRDVISNRL